MKKLFFLIVVAIFTINATFAQTTIKGVILDSLSKEGVPFATVAVTKEGTLNDFAMTGITAYSKVILRFATFIGFGIGALSFLIAIVYFILKLIHWDWFRSGIAPLVIGVFFLGGVELFFIGLLGEYILAINQRVLHRPLVVEEERLNFETTIDKNGQKSSEQPEEISNIVN